MLTLLVAALTGLIGTRLISAAAIAFFGRFAVSAGI